MLKIGEFSKLSHLTVKAYRQLGLTIEEIKSIANGQDIRRILAEKAEELRAEKSIIDTRLSIINHILEDKNMKYQVTEKNIPETTVYYSETVLKNYNDIRIRHNEAVTELGNESENIKFRILPATKVISIYHKGAYDSIGEAYAFIYKYAEDNGYDVAGLSRECYIDGIWNKESEEDWLTEVQLPVK